MESLPPASTIPPSLLGKKGPPPNSPPHFAAILSPEEDTGNNTKSADAFSAYDEVIDNNNGQDFWFRSELPESRKAKENERWHLKKTLKFDQWERRDLLLSHGTKRCVKNNRAFYLHEFKTSNSTVAYYLLRRIDSRPAVAQTGSGSHQPHIVPNIESSNQQVPSAVSLLCTDILLSPGATGGERFSVPIEMGPNINLMPNHSNGNNFGHTNSLQLINCAPMAAFPNNSRHFVASNGAHYGSASQNAFRARSTGQAAGYVVPSGNVSHYTSLGCEGNNQRFWGPTSGELLSQTSASLGHNTYHPNHNNMGMGYMGQGFCTPIDVHKNIPNHNIVSSSTMDQPMIASSGNNQSFWSPASCELLSQTSTSLGPNTYYPSHNNMASGYLGAGFGFPVAPGAFDTGRTWGFPNDNNNTFDQATATFPNNATLGGEGILRPAIDTELTRGFPVDNNNIASITTMDERIEHERAVETNDNFEATATFPNNATLGGEVLTDVMAETKALSGEVHMPQEIKSWSIAHGDYQHFRSSTSGELLSQRSPSLGPITNHSNDNNLLDTGYLGEGFCTPAINEAIHTEPMVGFTNVNQNIASSSAMDERVIASSTMDQPMIASSGNYDVGMISGTLEETSQQVFGAHMFFSSDMYNDAGGLDDGHTIMPAAFLGHEHETGRIGFDESIWRFNDEHDVSINANGDWELDSAQNVAQHF